MYLYTHGDVKKACTRHATSYSAAGRKDFSRLPHQSHDDNTTRLFDAISPWTVCSWFGGVYRVAHAHNVRNERFADTSHGLLKRHTITSVPFKACETSSKTTTADKTNRTLGWSKTCDDFTYFAGDGKRIVNRSSEVN